MTYELGFCDPGAECPYDCHGWRHTLSLSEYFHLVDHHLAFSKELCEEDLRSFFAYANTNDTLLTNTYMGVSAGYTSTYSTAIDYNTGVQLSGGRGGSGSPAPTEEYISGREELVIVGSVPEKPATITVPPEPFETYDIDTLVVAGYRVDPEDSTPIILTAYDAEDNVVGVNTDYKFGADITVTLTTNVTPAGFASILSDWTVDSGDAVWNAGTWYSASGAVVLKYTGDTLSTSGGTRYSFTTPAGGVTVSTSLTPNPGGVNGSVSPLLDPFASSIVQNSSILTISAASGAMRVSDVEYYAVESSALRPFSYITTSGPDIAVKAVLLASATDHRRIFPNMGESSGASDTAALIQTHVLEVL